MAELGDSKSRIFWIIVSGIVSLIVGVGVGILVNHLTRERRGLDYEVVSSEVFRGQTQNLAIISVRAFNRGNKEIEDFFCQVVVDGASLVEYKVTGLPASARTITVKDTTFELRAPFLNPDEIPSAQLLLSLTSASLRQPIVQVRGKGVTGKERDILSQKRSVSKDLFAIVAASITVLVALFGAMTTMRQVRARQLEMGPAKNRHHDDQRDIVAYILGINGFNEKVDMIRSSERELSYWSLADALTEQCLQKKDLEETQRVIKVLQNLLEYASIADSSCLIIHYNIARAAARVGDMAMAGTHLSQSKKGKEGFILKRISFDEVLSNLDAKLSMHSKT